ncbi:MAG TPA: hypothetical protein PKL92_05400 [Aquaticitalea sp.]|nr:hypothetical protein [Aquaticitalea sp.]
MKNIILQLLVVIFLAVSCASEDLAIQNKSEKITLNKSTEMLDFEKSLKDYFTSKSENSENFKKNEAVIVKQSRVLLSSIGVIESEIDKNAVTPESLISYTLKQYAEALSKLKNN